MIEVNNNPTGSVFSEFIALWHRCNSEHALDAQCAKKAQFLGSALEFDLKLDNENTSNIIVLLI